MTLKEVDALLSIIIAMGIVGYPTIRYKIDYIRQNYNFFSFRSYWSQKWPFANTNFSSIMSGRQFELLTKFLHLNDSENILSRDSSSYDRLHKIRPFLDVLLTNFKKKKL